MLTGNHQDAMQAFNAALANLQTDPNVTLPLGTELKLAQAEEELKLKQAGGRRSQEASTGELKASRLLDELLGLNSATPLK